MLVAYFLIEGFFILAKDTNESSWSSPPWILTHLSSTDISSSLTTSSRRAVRIRTSSYSAPGSSVRAPVAAGPGSNSSSLTKKCRSSNGSERRLRLRSFEKIPTDKHGKHRHEHVRDEKPSNSSVNRGGRLVRCVLVPTRPCRSRLRLPRLNFSNSGLENSRENKAHWTRSSPSRDTTVTTRRVHLPGSKSLNETSSFMTRFAEICLGDIDSRCHYGKRTGVHCCIVAVRGFGLRLFTIGRLRVGMIWTRRGEIFRRWLTRTSVSTQNEGGQHAE